MYSRRLQIQDTLAKQIADAISRVVDPRGVAVPITAAHTGMTMRGVEKPQSVTTTSLVLGEVQALSISWRGGSAAGRPGQAGAIGLTAASCLSGRGWAKGVFYQRKGERVETKIRGDLIALEQQVRSQVETLRDELLGRYATSVSEVLVELGEEQQPGFPKSYNCAITVTTGPGDRISSRCRERVIGNALRKGFEAVALEVKRSLRRRLVPAPELAA